MTKKTSKSATENKQTAGKGKAVKVPTTYCRHVRLAEVSLVGAKIVLNYQCSIPQIHTLGTSHQTHTHHRKP